MSNPQLAAKAMLSLGRVYSDLVFRGLETMPQLGREVFARNFDLTPGGGAFITAAHAVARGRPTFLLARYGIDPISQALETQLGSFGIDLKFLDRANDAGPQLTVVMVDESERAFLSRRAGHALPSTFEAALEWSAATHLHIAEYATLHEIPYAASAAKRCGHSVSLDPSWDSDLIADPAFFDRMADVDVFLPNLEEARALTGCEAPEEALEHLAQRFPVVAVKCGRDGALSSMNGALFRQSPPSVEVIDTTGAGDAFNAGFLHAWLDGAGGEQCLAEGIAAGSASVTAVGGTGNLQALTRV